MRDIVFQNAVAVKENLPEIYKSLFPDQIENFEATDFESVTSETIILNHTVNTLSFFVPNDSQMVYIETVSDWELNDFERLAEYAFSILVKTLTSETDFKPFRVKNEIFILSTSGKEPEQKEFYLYDYLDLPDDVQNYLPNFKFTVISRKNDNVPEGTVLDKYFRFCEIQIEVYQELGRTKEAYTKIIEKCIAEDIFVDYISNKRDEVMINLGELKNQKKETKRFVNQKVKEAKKEIKEEVQSKIYANLLATGMDKDKAYDIVYNISN